METQLQAIKVFLWRSPTSCCHMLIQADLQVYKPVTFHTKVKKKTSNAELRTLGGKRGCR